MESRKYIYICEARERKYQSTKQKCNRELEEKERKASVKVFYSWSEKLNFN